MEINLIPYNQFKSQIIDACIYLSSNTREILQDLKKFHLNIEGKSSQKEFFQRLFLLFSYPDGQSRW